MRIGTQEKIAWQIRLFEGSLVAGGNLVEHGITPVVVESEEASAPGREEGAEEFWPFVVQIVEDTDDFFDVEAGVEVADAAFGSFTRIHAIGVDFYSLKFDNAEFAGYCIRSAGLVFDVGGEDVAGGVFIAVDDQIAPGPAFVAEEAEFDAGKVNEFLPAEEVEPSRNSTQHEGPAV